jgi:hypothetical protein
VGRYYILQGDQAIEEPDHAKWLAWRNTSFEQVCAVAQTDTKYGAVATRFLGINMTLSRNEPPLLFETRVRGGWLDDEWERFSTLAEAKAGHQAWVARVREMEAENELPPPGCRVW